MQTKTCTKCGIEKATTEFHKDKKGKYGVHNRCKECKREYLQQPEVKRHTSKYHREYLREYQQRPEVKERRLEREREYRQNPDIRNRIRKRDREDKRKLREMGILSNQHVEIAKKHATRSGRWSDAEIEFLMSSELPLVDIALELGRTYPSVQLKRVKVRKLLNHEM